MKKVPRIVILGPQGGGKGTQADRLARRWHIPHISTGQLLRDEMARGTSLGQRITTTMNRGRLIPVRLTNEVMRRRLSQPDCRLGWICDGYPRNMAQARPFARFGRPNVLIVLHLLDQAAVRRLAGRRVCPQGHVYHLRYDPPKKRRGYCDRDGLRLWQRDDDTPSAIRQRLRIYHRETEPVLRWFRKRVMIISVEARWPIPTVYRHLLSQLKRIPWLSSRLQQK
ncbi:MAG: nucleoside monophosphate kinase [Patescibacteria group bacterium]